MTSSLSINRHHIRADSFIVKHTHTHRLAHISQTLWLWVFISLSFLFSSFIILSPHSHSLFSFFSSLIVFHHLSIAPLFCFSFKLIAFISVSFSLISTLSLAPAPSLSLRLAVFIFQSFISTNVRQCFCPPSIDPQRAKDGEREAGRKGGKAVKKNEAERKL